MSSAARIAWDPEEGMTLEQWTVFCRRHKVVYSPQTVGRHVFYAGDVEIKFGKPTYDPLPSLPDGGPNFSEAVPPKYAEEVSVSTFHGGAAIPEVAALAMALWREHGGHLSADPEVRRAIG